MASAQHWLGRQSVALLLVLRHTSLCDLGHHMDKLLRIRLSCRTLGQAAFPPSLPSVCSLYLPSPPALPSGLRVHQTELSHKSLCCGCVWESRCMRHSWWGVGVTGKTSNLNSKASVAFHISKSSKIPKGPLVFCDFRSFSGPEFLHL